MPGLINHWSFDTNLTYDSVGDAHLTGISGCLRTADRCGRVNSALSLAGGYLTMPQRVYFAGDFSITVWAKAANLGNYARIIDCGIGQLNNVQFALQLGSVVNPPFFKVTDGIPNTLRLEGVSQLTNTWTFLTVTLSGTALTMYVDSIQVSQLTNSYVPSNVLRTACYIGKSNWLADEFSDSLLDELKIYNRALSPIEVQLEMKLQPCTTSNIYN